MSQPLYPKQTSLLDESLLTDLEEDVVPEYTDSPQLLLLTGSAVADPGMARDYDLILIEEGEFEQRFVTKETADAHLEIDIWETQALESFVDHYYWRTHDIVAALGKLSNSRIVRRYRDVEAIDRVFKFVNDVPIEPRLYVLSFHLGVLHMFRKKSAPPRMHDPGWSIVSCLASIENKYPVSLRSDILSETYHREFPDLITLALDGEPREHIESAIEAIIEQVPDSLTGHGDLMLDTSAVPLYYPENRAGAKLLGFEQAAKSNEYDIFSFDPR